MEVCIHYLYEEVFPEGLAHPPKVDEILEDGRKNMLDLICIISERARSSNLSIENIRPGLCIREMEARLHHLFIAFWGAIDVDESENLLDACLIYLDRRSDDKAVVKARITNLMDMLERMEESKPEHIESAAAEDEDAKIYKSCCQKLVAALVDFSEPSEFVDVAGWPPTDGSLSFRLQGWLSTSDPMKQQAACFMFGNIAVSDAMCVDMVKQGTAKDATRLIIESLDRDVQYAAAGWLRHLAFPPAKSHKKMLLEANYLQASLTLISANSDAQLSLAGLSLLRRLLQNSLLACQLLLGSVTDVKYTKGAESLSLSMITDTCSRLDPKSPISLPLVEEGARIVIAVARCIVKSGSDENSELAEERRRFFEDENVVESLTKTLRNTNNEVVRADCWFGLALMANCTQGANVVAQHLGEEGIGPDILDHLMGMQNLKGSKGTKDQEKLQAVLKQNLDNAMSINNGILKYAVRSIFHERL